jgi:hypothetical protein
VPALAGDAPRKGFGDADDGFHDGDDSSDEHNEDGNDDDDGLTLTTSTVELYTATAPPAKSLDSSETASAALDQTGDAQGRHRDEPAHGGLSHGGEQALIAVGSISEESRLRAMAHTTHTHRSLTIIQALLCYAAWSVGSS